MHSLPATMISRRLLLVFVAAANMLSKQPHGPTAKVVVGLRAISLGLLAQLLMFGLEMAIERSPFPFPSSILAMFLLFMFLLGLGCFWKGFESFYISHLRQPANVVNRHMSVGFSVPIVMLARSPVASGDTIARIMACFITAGIVSTTAVYLLAIGSQELFSTCTRNFPLHRRCDQLDDEEAARSCKNERHSARLLSVICAKLPASTSDVSTVGSIHDAPRHTNRDGAEMSTEVRESTPADPGEKPWATGIVYWVLDNPLLVSTWFFTLAVCIPIRYGTGLEEPLGVSLLLTIWATVLALQNGIKTSNIRLLRLMPPKLRTALSVACNPVLWTALGLIAYASAEGHRSSRPISEMLATLEQNTTFTDLVMHRADSDSKVYIDFRLSGNITDTTTVLPQQQSPTDYAHRPTPNIAAGDVANAILSTGLVCWGLKLWEYRRRLLSSAGFTILLVSCLAALGNVVLGPLLAREILGPRSEPSYDLAFVARSVTLALGAPAVAKLGGEVGLNAAMVVVNGIMCQMLLGLGVGEWLGRRANMLRVKVGRWRVEISSEDESRRRALHKDDREKSHGNQGRHHGRDVLQGIVLGPAATPRDHLPAKDPPGPQSTRSEPRASDMTTNPTAPTTDTSTIASGVTVGINAAAMGTAHLYEAGSEAAPYSALAMTVFGVATVGFTMIPQLGGWVAGIVGQV